MRETALKWLAAYSALSFPAKAGLVLFFFALTSMISMGVAIFLPADTFVRRKKLSLGPLSPTFFVRIFFKILRNGLGFFCLLLGLVLSLPLVPGPGALFMLLGLGLAEFPGKRRLEIALIRLPHMLITVNRLRARFGRAPLIDPTA